MLLVDHRVRGFLDRLASRAPTPGGGSAAAVTVALGAALYAKVAAIVLARRTLATTPRRAAQRALVVGERSRRALTRLIDQDSKAYAALRLTRVDASPRASALRLTRVDASPRASALRLTRADATSAALRRAQRRAMDAPLKICAQAVAVLHQTAPLERAAGPLLVSDVTAGSSLLLGGFAAAAATVAANLDGLGRTADADAIRRQLSALVQRARRRRG